VSRVAEYLAVTSQLFEGRKSSNGLTQAYMAAFYEQLQNNKPTPPNSSLLAFTTFVPVQMTTNTESFRGKGADHGEGKAGCLHYRNEF